MPSDKGISSHTKPNRVDYSATRHVSFRYSEGEMYGDRGEKIFALCPVRHYMAVRYGRRKFASMKSCSLSSVWYSKGSAIARSGIARVDCMYKALPCSVVTPDYCYIHLSSTIWGDWVYPSSPHLSRRQHHVRIGIQTHYLVEDRPPSTTSASPPGLRGTYWWID